MSGLKERYIKLSNDYQRVDKFDRAINTVGDLANDLQRGDFSRYPRFSPYGSNNDFFAKRERVKQVVKRAKESINSLRARREDATREINNIETLGLYLRYRRNQMGMSFRDICKKGGLEIKKPKNLSRVELAHKKIRRKYIDAYQRAGIEIPKRLIIKNFMGENPSEPKNLSQFLRAARMATGLTIEGMGRRINYSAGSLSSIEEGKKRVSKKVLKGYKDILDIDIPKKLIEDDKEQRRSTIKKRNLRILSNQLKRHEAQGPEKGNELGYFLRLERLKTGLSARKLAEMTGYTPTNISFVENGRVRIVNENFLNACEQLFNTVIPQNLRDENRKRQENLNKRKAEGIRKYQFGP